MKKQRIASPGAFMSILARFFTAPVETDTAEPTKRSLVPPEPEARRAPAVPPTQEELKQLLREEAALFDEAPGSKEFTSIAPEQVDLS